jgi:hypothetical protein
VGKERVFPKAPPPLPPVFPAKAGIHSCSVVKLKDASHNFEGDAYVQSSISLICQQVATRLAQWVPAFAGMTV